MEFFSLSVKEKKLVAFGIVFKPDWNAYITGGEPAAASASDLTRVAQH